MPSLPIHVDQAVLACPRLKGAAPLLLLGGGPVLSPTQYFWFGISLEYPKLENIGMGYTMIILLLYNPGLVYLGITQDILGIAHNVQPDHSPPHFAAALSFLLVCVAWLRLAPFCRTAIRRSSFSVTDRPLKQGLPRPNCQNHGFTS